MSLCRDGNKFVQATGSGFEQIAITAGPVRHQEGLIL